ncbi:MAG: SprT family zinc-dependent metalloprotease [Candidatus Buchananbacteria bacterium]
MAKPKLIEKEILLDQKNISYLLYYSRKSKRIRLVIGLNGQLRVGCPRFVPLGRVEEFIQEKSGWVLKNLSRFDQSKNQNLLISNREDYLKNRAAARFFVAKKLDYFNEFYNLRINRIAIKNQRTCWGSCSKKGNLNFNFKIIFLPEDLADLIIVHELCHLAEFNHSPKFWALVAKVLPDYLLRRKKLKQHQLGVAL